MRGFPNPLAIIALALLLVACDEPADPQVVAGAGSQPYQASTRVGGTSSAQQPHSDLAVVFLLAVTSGASAARTRRRGEPPL